jgi:hypothetical protein
MALYADRVKDSTSLTGTGAVTLSGTASAGYQTFATAFGATPQTVAYCIADQTGSNWEVGTGVFNGTTGLTRVTVLASSNAGALVSFTGGTQDVFNTAPARYLQLLDAGNITGLTLATGATSPTLTVQTGAPTATQNGGALTVKTSNATAAAKGSGALTISSGNGLTTGTSGAINIQSGTSGSGTSGSINVSTGTTSGTRGDINLTSKYTYVNSTIYGNATVTTPYGNWGGSLNIFGQDVTGYDYGGFINIKAGSGEQDGGDLNLGSGDAISFGQAGDVYIKAGDADIAGNLYISAGSTLTGNGYGGSIYIRAGTGSGTGGGGNIAIIPGEKQTVTIKSGPNNGSINLAFSDTSGTASIGSYGGISTINVAYQSIGFYNATPITKPTVTGSRATGAALVNLLTQLANIGLITDSTTT